MYEALLGFSDYGLLGFLENGYGLMATKFKFKFRGLFVLHFRITDYYWSLVQLYFMDYFFYNFVIRIISKIYPGLWIIQIPPNRASCLHRGGLHFGG